MTFFLFLYFISYMLLYNNFCIGFSVSISIFIFHKYEKECISNICAQIEVLSDDKKLLDPSSYVLNVLGSKANLLDPSS